MLKILKRKPSKKELIISLAMMALMIILVFFFITINAQNIKKARDNRIPFVISKVTSLQPIATNISSPSTSTKDEEKAITPPSLKELETTDALSKVDVKTPLTSTTDEDAILKQKPSLSQQPDQDVNYFKNVKEQEFLEKTEFGFLPKKDSQGRQPWKFYTQNFIQNSKKSRISIIVNNLGFDTHQLKSILSSLPKTVTLALNPYSDMVKESSDIIKSSGYEYLMMLPMESNDYPINDPGSKALLTTIGQEENLQHLHWVMGKSTGYIGLINYMGKAFIRPNTILDLLFSELEKRGLIYLNSLGLEFNIGEKEAYKKGVPYLSIDLVIDEVKTENAISQQLRSLELLSKEFGYAIGMIHNYPLSLKQLNIWNESLVKKNIEIVPISNLILQPILKD